MEPDEFTSILDVLHLVQLREVPVERFYRDARLFRLYEGTSEIQKLIIAKQMVKEFLG